MSGDTQQILLRDGTVAKLVGRMSVNNGRLLIYSVQEDKPYVVASSNNDIAILTPTKSFASKMSVDNVNIMLKNGTKGSVIHHDYWERIKFGSEIEVYDEEDNLFYRLEDYELLTKKRKEKAKQKKMSNAKDKDTAQTQDTETEELPNTVQAMGGAFMEGGKIAAARKANRKFSALLRKYMKNAGLPAQYVDSELAKLALEVAGPSGIHYIVTRYSRKIDKALGKGKSKMIADACLLAGKGVGIDVVEPALDFILPMLNELASIGFGSLKDLAGFNEDDEEEELEEVKLASTKTA